MVKLVLGERRPLAILVHLPAVQEPQELQVARRLEELSEKPERQVFLVLCGREFREVSVVTAVEEVLPV